MINMEGSNIKRILSQIRRAIQDYKMIEENDRIVVGLSGGKDSTTLLLALNSLRNFYPKKFEIEAVTIDMGLHNQSFEPIKKLCLDKKINYTIEKTHIGKIVFDIRNEKNPCSMCANLRRGALNNVAVKLNCNKVALGHNKEDVIETFFLSTIFEGRIHTFSPVTYLSRKNIYLIRPLIYSEEKYIRKFVKTNDIKIIKNQCLFSSHSKRAYIKNFINELNFKHTTVKSNIFGAIKRSRIDEW